MNHKDARRIADYLLEYLKPGCEPGRAMIVGSLRRGSSDVHDIELALKPRQGRPAPVFGQSVFYNSHLDKLFYDLEDSRTIFRLRGGAKMKQYKVNTQQFRITSLNSFAAEFYICTPPAQWGVLLVIRTGPAETLNNFSRFCVTNRSAGGILPDGYKVKHLGVWRQEQLDERGEPRKGETPLPMPEEGDFLEFLGQGWVEPWNRRAPYR